MTDHTDDHRPSLVARAVDQVLEAAVWPSNTKLGATIRRRLLDWQPAPPDALDGRTVVVTGATSGIGRALADQLAVLGAEVHAVGRDGTKVRDLVALLGANATGHVADLSRLADVRRLADEMADACDEVHVLAHIAGMLAEERTMTDDGIELTAQVHVVSPFLLTERLLPHLTAASGRVITMSSAGLYATSLDVAELFDPPDPYRGAAQYARAKRAQVELNTAWAARHADIGVAFSAAHPGWVQTPGLRAGLPRFERIHRPVLRDAELGADTANWLTWTDDAPPPDGRFWHDRRPRRTDLVPWTASSDAARDELWDALTERAGLPQD